MTTTIQNMRGGRKPSGAGAVRIDRQTVWGNPFRMATERDRSAVIRRHYRWVLEQTSKGAEPYTWERLRTLSEADSFWCWCAPKRCHGEALRELAQAAARAGSPADLAAWAQAQLQTA